jgi:hypothetical protein
VILDRINAAGRVRHEVRHRHLASEDKGGRTGENSEHKEFWLRQPNELLKSATPVAPVVLVPQPSEGTASPLPHQHPVGGAKREHGHAH